MQTRSFNIIRKRDTRDIYNHIKEKRGITAQVAGRWYNDGYITADTFASVLIGVFSGELRTFYNDVAKLFTTTDEPEEEPESPAPQNTPSQGQ